MEYVDAHHADGVDKGYSTTGVVLDLAGAPVDWKSVKLTVVTMSLKGGRRACGVVESVMMMLHLRHLLKTIGREQSQATVVFEDNLSALATSQSNKISPPTKHVCMWKFHHLRSLLIVADNVVDVEYFETGLEKADILLESLGALNFISTHLMLFGITQHKVWWNSYEEG